MKTRKIILLTIILGILLAFLPSLAWTHDEVVKATGNIEISKDEVVDADVVAMTGDISILGKVNGNITAFKGNIYLKEGAIINGDVIAFMGNVFKESNVTVHGKIQEFRNSITQDGIKAIAQNARDIHPEIRYVERNYSWGNSIMQLLGLAALTLIGLSLFSNSTNRMNLWLQQNTGSVLIKGFLGWLALPFIIIALVITIIGIPIAIISLLLIPVPFIIGLWVIGLFAGEKLLPIIKKNWEKNNVLEGVLGVVVIWLAMKAPFIGFLLFPVIAIIGLGIILDSKFGTGKPWFNNKKGDDDDAA